VALLAIDVLCKGSCAGLGAKMSSAGHEAEVAPSLQSKSAVEVCGPNAPSACNQGNKADIDRPFTAGSKC